MRVEHDLAWVPPACVLAECDGGSDQLDGRRVMSKRSNSRTPTVWHPTTTRSEPSSQPDHSPRCTRLVMARLVPRAMEIAPTMSLGNGRVPPTAGPGLLQASKSLSHWTLPRKQV